RLHRAGDAASQVAVVEGVATLFHNLAVAAREVRLRHDRARGRRIALRQQSVGTRSGVAAQTPRVFAEDALRPWTHRPSAFGEVDRRLTQRRPVEPTEALVGGEPTSQN